MHVARARGGEKYLAFDTGGVFETDPDPVAERRGVEGTRVGRIEDQLVVAHVELRVEHAVAHTSEDAEPVVAVIEVLPGAGRVRQLLDVAVDERLDSEGNGNEVVTLRFREFLARRATVEQLVAPLQ